MSLLKLSSDDPINVFIKEPEANNSWGTLVFNSAYFLLFMKLI